MFGNLFKKKTFPKETSASGGIRLHLGCGQDYLPGFINIDSHPSAKCDVHMDFCDLKKNYSPDSVDEIVMIHSLSYLRLWQARDLFNDMFHLLKSGGKLTLELPDVVKCAGKLIDSTEDLTSYLEGVRGFYAFDFDMIEHKEMFTPYAFGWSSWHLKSELKHAGFSKILICDPQTHGARLWRDTRIEAIK